MLRTINQKFYILAGVLVILFGAGYSELAYFLHKQSENAARSQHVVYMDREVRTVQDLFFELRFWDRAVLSQELPEADRQFGRLMGRMKKQLSAINLRAMSAQSRRQLTGASDLLAKYETAFNRMVQLKTEERLNHTRLDSSFQALRSTALRSNNTAILKPLFTLNHFQTNFLATHRESEHRALKLVIDSLQDRFVRADLLDERMRGYIETFKELVDKDFAIAEQAERIKERFEEISQQLSELLNQLSLEAETLLVNQFNNAERIRTRLHGFFILTTTFSVIALLLILTVIARKIVHPIRAVSEVMRKIYSGDTEARFGYGGSEHDELVQLGRAFNDMLDSLQDKQGQVLKYQRELESKIQELGLREEELTAHRHSLEEMVKERTRELQQAIDQLHEEILQRKRVEQELTEHRGRLENLVQERTAELVRINEELHREMTRRQKATEEREALIAELEAKNAELERFTYTVSHDLKSPLITIRGFLGFVEQDAASGNFGRMKADLARIADAAAKMQQLLNQLLELSRIGRLISDLEEFSFEDLVREAIDTVAGRLRERSVRLEMDSHLPMLYGDRHRLREVMENLLDNAVKYMGEQPNPVVKIGSRRDGDAIVLCVRDNGVGIDPRYHEKIFGLFDKLDSSAEGTGVGLAIAKRIVEVHGGQLWVESAGVGRGSTFCFTLPSKRARERKETGCHEGTTLDHTAH